MWRKQQILLSRLLLSTSSTRRKIQSREGFGSFHSEDVEKLIRLPESEFSIPPKCKEMASLFDGWNEEYSYGITPIV